MRRQRPIRSVLAGRKMFNGGMMMPLDTPPAMQNTPSGILASSQPLIDSATQEVVAPLSMASAPVSMAQGGIVQGFRKGGLQSREQYRRSRGKWQPPIDSIGPGLPGTGSDRPYDPSASDRQLMSRDEYRKSRGKWQPPVDYGLLDVPTVSAPRIMTARIDSAQSDNGDSGPYYTRTGDRTRLGPGSSPENLIARAEANPGELTNLMFPYEASITGRKKPGDPGYWNRGTSPSKMAPRVGADIFGIPPGETRAFDLLYKVPQAGLEQLFRGLSQAEAWVTRGLYDFYDASRTPKPEDQNWLKLYDQTFSVNNLLRRLPDIAGVSKEDLASEITDIAKQLVSNDLNISGEDIVNAVSEHLRNKYDAPVLEQYDLSLEGGGFSTEKEQADAFLAMEINRLYPRMPEEEVNEIIKAKELNPDSSIEELVRLSYPDEIVAAYATPGGSDTSRPGDLGMDYEGMGGTVVDPKERVSTAADVDASVASTHVLTEADIRAVYPKATRKQVKIIMDASKNNPGLNPEQIARLIIGTSDDYHDATTPSDAAAAAAAAGAAVASDDTTAASRAATDATVPPPADGIGPGLPGTGGPSPAAAASPAASEVISAAVDDDEYGTTKGVLGEYLGDEDDIVDLMRGELRQAVGEVRATASNPKKTPAETKRKIKYYLNEFKKAAPEYEGASPQEKALVLVDAGLRIMAGQSPNAITNIANGLKGIGKELAKDDKEKRAYDRQVDLSAAKYALAAVNKDRERLLAFEKSENDVVQVMSPTTGDLKTITKADLRTGNIPVGYLPTSDPYKNWIDGVKTTERLIAAQAKLKGKGEITAKWLDVGKTYLTDAQRVLDSVQSKTLLGPAIQTLFATNPDGSAKVPITGIRGVMNSAWNRAGNALGIRGDDTMRKQGEKRDMYISRVKAVIAKKITQILGESNRTISTPDRTRADEIAGVFSDWLWDPATRDPDILRDKIKILWQTLDNDEKSGLAGMARAEQSVGNLTVPGGGMLYADVLRGQRRALFSTKVGVGPKGKVRKLSDFGYDIETGTWTK